MQKRILIIGNDDGLPGVKVDMQKYKSFFKSSNGGTWNDNEIIEKLNPSHEDIVSQLERLKNMQLDYLIVVFSGHGGQLRETVLELNDNNEHLAESRLENLAVRQLNIFDCCRAYPSTLTESVRNKLEFKAYSVKSTRERYEKRILEAIPQFIRLYACAIGEKAHDTSEGGAYSKNLIDSSISTNEFTTVGTAHVQAADLTSKEFRDQNPSADLPRCLSFQQLVIGIRP